MQLQKSSVSCNNQTKGIDINQEKSLADLRGVRLAEFMYLNIYYTYTNLNHAKHFQIEDVVTVSNGQRQIDQSFAFTHLQGYKIKCRLEMMLLTDYLTKKSEYRFNIKIF